MGAPENKQLMRRVFAELANGNGQPFMDALANDARWTVIGSSPWSRTYEGKRAITDELMGPLFRQFADRYKARAIRIIAEDDVVVVEARGEVTTKSKKPYNQTYCYVFHLTDGKVRKLTEYLDTDLVNQVLDASKPLAWSHPSASSRRGRFLLASSLLRRPGSPLPGRAPA